MTRYSIYKNEILKDKKSYKLDFEVDGRKHYVYRVTDLNRMVEENYIGSRTSSNNDLFLDFWTYKTSSKHNIINENKKEQYKIKILKVFNNPGDKMLYESFLHQLYNVKNNTKFWNKSNQTPFGFDTTGLKFGTPSEEHRNNLRKANLGKKLSSKTKEKISRGCIKRFENPEEGNRISETLKQYNSEHPEASRNRIAKMKENGTDKNHTKKYILEDALGHKDEFVGQRELQEFCKRNNLSYKKIKMSINKGIININMNDKRTTKETRRCNNMKITKK